MTNWYTPQSQGAFSGFKRIPLPQNWFEAYEIADNLLVFYEPRHYEGTIVNLVIGKQKAALIDSACGIGNLREAVGEITDKPVVVINTHTHLDHLGGNRRSPLVSSGGEKRSSPSDLGD